MNSSTFDFSTPDLGPESNKLKDKFYPPSEDTYLLLDSLEKDSFIIHKLNPLISLEVGCGSGIITTFLARMLGPNCIYFATDINHYACLATKYTTEYNKCSVQIVNTDLVSNTKLHKFVDLLVFNPPYVVTSEVEVGGCGIEASWAGGADGRVVTNRLLSQIPNLLSPTGVFYLLLIKQNKPEEVREYLEGFDIKGELVMERRAANEHLFVYRYQRNKCVY
ncbi:HemK methyltransferase family member 2 [Oopsacas minuta]|uniref:Methyltransferase HEMK2 n=1 Tax=Oopsacas minuta TaxID=111878 RepID=A0AAV7JUW6_9METZ|nr:HemK methyltransferase family member 2 [Oopsacas minuta]